MKLFDLLTKDKDQLEQGIEKTKSNLFSRLSRIVLGKSRIGTEILDELEELLITADVGVDTTLRIIERVEKRVAQHRFNSVEELALILREEVLGLLMENSVTDFSAFNAEGIKPHVILVIGVNGVGKTTTIAKLAHRMKQSGKSVFLGAADTFRAAAIEQLSMWAERIGVPIVKQEMGADPASVAFDTFASAKARGGDVVLIDTAGRLHNKKHLMEELAKIKRVLGKQEKSAPHEVLLVLDGSTGQNAYEQAKQFSQATDISALAITKLDGSAKGGVVLGISESLQVPIQYIGVGEKLDDIQLFDKELFVRTLFQSR